MWKLYSTWLLLSLTGITLLEVSGLRCLQTQHFCRDDEKCIPASFRCDSDRDCSDGSDEDGCDVRKCDERDEFSCGDGECIPKRWQCDGEADCSDLSDESNSTCYDRTCQENQFLCPNSGQCIPKTWRCDHQPDCPGKEDELDCPTTDTCADGEFMCLGDSSCITVRWVCDQDEDCEDGSDEGDCPDPETTCSPAEFKCNGEERCIPKAWTCDGDSDCVDASDESKHHANCSDETNNHACAHDTEFQCDNMDCIHGNWVCDGDADCMDGSDENDCPIIPCSDEQFRCNKSSHCISKSYYCDGQVDCSDGSDEEDCDAAVEPTVCEEDQFDCTGTGSQCIPLEKVCDSAQDCLLGQDEESVMCHEENPCKTNNGQCSDICVRDYTIGSFHCECSPGFYLHSDGRDCLDINECESNDNPCSQICTNTKGHYKCDCRQGYWLENSVSCRADNEEPSLLFANRNDLRQIKIHSGEYIELAKDTRSAIALDYDFKEKTLYWSDVAQEKIFSLPIGEEDISKAQPLVTKSVVTPDGIAVDWVNKNLYWTDTGLNSLSVLSLTKNVRKTLVNTDMEEPRAIVVDPRQGHQRIYWSDWGSKPKIESIGMDGADRKTIVDRGSLAWPNGLTIDYETDRLFWVDAKLHVIGSCKLDGSDVKRVFTSYRYLKHPFAITVFEDSVYWTDWETESILKTNKFGRDDRVLTVAHNLQSPMDVHVFHPLKQPATQSGCSEQNGGCSHLCLPVAYSPADHNLFDFKCACPDVEEVGFQWKLNGDHKTCRHSHILNDQGVTVTASPGDASDGSQNGKGAENHDESFGTSARTMGRIAGIVIGILALMIIIGIVIGCVVYRSYVKKNVRSMNFDNPVYRKTTEDQFSLEKNQYQPATTRDLPSTLEPLNPEEEIA